MAKIEKSVFFKKFVVQTRFENFFGLTFVPDGNKEAIHHKKVIFLFLISNCKKVQTISNFSNIPSYIDLKCVVDM